MMRTKFLGIGLAVILLGTNADAQTVEAVVNVGDWTPRLTLGTIGAVFGTNLAPRECVAQALPLPNDLCGAQVLIRDATGAEALAPLFYVSPGQVNFLVPVSQWFNGKDPVRRQQQTTIAVTVCVSGACVQTALNLAPEPAILQWNNGQQAQPVITHADGRLVWREDPAAWGEILIVYAIGLGIYDDNGAAPAPGYPADGFPAPLDRLVPLLYVRVDQVEDEVNGIPVSGRYELPTFTGLAPGFVGLAQINFRVSCLTSNAAEPRIILHSSLFGTETKAFTIPMSEAARATWGGRGCN